MGVGMPQGMLLRQFGEYLRDAFGEMPYHVGSSLRQKDGWRDVDVRILLPDDEYERQGFGNPERPQHNAKWVATMLAWSAFGRALTGLPIDFQVQQRTHANREFSTHADDTGNRHPRSALFSLTHLDKA